ncbi:MAG: glycosyltransferase family 39 protein [Chloroflexota bacterium]
MRTTDDRAIAAALRRRQLLEAGFLALLLLIPILLYLPFMHAPFERDEGTYATIAQGLLHGKLPYRDLFDNKPPLIYGWYAISFLLFGETVSAPRLLASACLSLTGVALYQQVRLVLPKRVAVLSALLFAISTGLPMVALNANTEAYMLLPLVSSLMFFTFGLQRGGSRWFFLSGLAAGLAIMTKQVAVFNLLALAAVSLVWYRRHATTQLQAISPACWMLGGAAVSSALVALPFALSGALSDFVYATLSYNWAYISFLTLAQRLENMGYGVLFFCLIAAPFVAGALGGIWVVWQKRASATAADYALVLWAVASAIGVASGGRFFPHYFLQLMPALAVLTAIVIYDRVLDGKYRALGKPFWAGALALVVISIGTASIMVALPGRAEEQVASNVYTQKQWEQYSEELGEYIQAQTGPNDVIFNYGLEPQVYFYANRQPAIPYFNDWVLKYDAVPMQDIINDLDGTQPAYIIDSIQAPLFDNFGAAHPPMWRDFMAAHYDYVGRVQFADVYRLKGYVTPPDAGQP